MVVHLVATLHDSSLTTHCQESGGGMESTMLLPTAEYIPNA